MTTTLTVSESESKAGTMQTVQESDDSPWKWALPDGLDVPADPLRLRVDFHSQAVIVRTFPEEGVGSVKLVSAQDVAHALASELTVSTGILPPNTLWWSNTRQGAVVALWREPKIWKVALQERAGEPPVRYEIPMPGLIFICSPGRTPWVFAAKRKPSRPADRIYRAPCFNIFDSGKVCPGTHTFPEKEAEIPESFFRSFFSPTGDSRRRSKAYGEGLKKRWETLQGREKYPMSDLVEHSKLQDLLSLNTEDTRW